MIPRSGPARDTLKYDPALDGLRAIAVSAVVLYHVDSHLLPGGWAGVDVFFVLSGFLITSILSREIERTGTVDLKRFYLRRALRLTPALALLLGFCALLIAARPEWRHDGIRAILFAGTYTMNWNRAFEWGPQWKLGHTWSLGMEEQFYLIWPVFLLVVRDHRKRLLLTLAVVGAIIAWRCNLAFGGADPERTYNGFDTHSDALLIGCILAFLAIPTDLRGLALLAFPAAAAFAVLMLFVPLRSVVTQTAGLTVAALVSLLLIVAARNEGWLRQLLSSRPLVYTGRISYGFYLWQEIFILLSYRHVPEWAMAVPVAGAYLTAVLSYKFVEQPLLRFKDHLHAKPEPVPVPVA